VTQNVLTALRPQAGREGLHVHAALTPARASGDPDLAEVLVTNLMSNALRYNIAGGWVKIVTCTTAAAASISVSNSGPAVPEEEIGRLFQPFQRLGSQRTRQPGGHGLGLAIVRAIAAAHGAGLHVHPGAAGGLDVEVRFDHPSHSTPPESSAAPRLRSRLPAA
jgi:signal transduction histidine kinase